MRRIPPRVSISINYVLTHVWNRGYDLSRVHDCLGAMVKTTYQQVTMLLRYMCYFWYVSPKKGGRKGSRRGGIKAMQWIYIASIGAKVYGNIETGDWSNCILVLPGKLRARPVQHPATPALMTAQGRNPDHDLNI